MNAERVFASPAILIVSLNVPEALAVVLQMINISTAVPLLSALKIFPKDSENDDPVAEIPSEVKPAQTP